MSVKLLENTSFSILRVNPKLSTNTKLVVDTKGGLFLESFDADEELSKSRYKAFRVSPKTSYEYDLSRFYKDTPNDIIYKIQRDSSDLSVLNDFSKQYEFNYITGAESVNSVSYDEEFGILAPLWLEKNVPDYFVIFRIEEPVSVNNKNAVTENENKNIVNDPNYFVENILKKATLIKTIDLTLNSPVGQYIRNYVNSERFPSSPLLFNFERNEPTYWNGIDIKQGGFTSKPEFIYDQMFGKDTTILEDEFFITQGFERNSLACANIINLYFLFDDKDVKDFTINRYFGLYVNELEEGKFQVSGKEMYMDSFHENQLPKPKDENFLVKDNTRDIVQVNNNGILVYIDKQSVTTDYIYNVDIDLDPELDLFNYSFLPTSNDVSSLNSIFYIKDKLNNFHNLKIGGSWNHGTQLRLMDNKINWKDFTGVEDPILTTAAKVTDKQGRACTFLRVNSTIPHGDRYFTGLIKKQIYRFTSDSVIPGNIFTITDDTSTSISVNAINSNINNLLEAIKVAWKNETNGKFPNFSVSVKGDTLIVYEKDYSGIDVNFTVSVSGASNFEVIKDVSASLNNYIITADSVSGIPVGRANGRFFNPTGTTKEIAKAMTEAFNNIKDGFFEATNIDDLIVLASKNTGSRFNDIAIGRDLFFTGAHVDIISNEIGFTHPDFSVWFYEGGNNEPESRVFIDIDRFNDFSIPNRFIKTVDKTGKETGLSTIKKVSYYIDEPIKDKSGKIVNYKNIDKYCTVIINDDEVIFRDSIKHVYLYELYKIPYGRFSLFPIKDMDVDFFSTEYGDEKELNTESLYYSNFQNAITSQLTHEDIEDFYENREFSTLQGQLENEIVDSNIESPKIEIEYDRLKENYIQELTTPSRIVPYINKWVYRNGKNSREHDYRLCSSEAFGITNFSPSGDEFTRDPDYFTHEWYYLQRLPYYYGFYDKSLLKNVFSYFPDPIDVTNTGLYNVNSDYFTEYFTVDLLKYPILSGATYINNIETIVSEELVPVKKQLRYSVFEGGNNVNFSTAFFRGVKVIVKERVESNTVINYNLQNIKFKESNRYNDYKFTAVLIPHDGQYPKNKKRKSVDIEFIENRKFKNITLLVYVRVDDLLNQINVEKYDTLTSSYITTTIPSGFIDRTILYALNSKFVSLSPLSLNSDGTMDYEDVVLTGAIDMRLSSGTDFSLGIVKGAINAAGEGTQFIDEIILNKQGSYNIIEAQSGPATRYFQVTEVNSDDQFRANPITGGPQPIVLTNLQVQNGTYIYKDGGYNYWDQRLTKVSYAAIANLVNNGDPEVSYITILEDGSVVENLYVVELQTAKPVIKPSYIKTISDDNKPVNFNLTDTIGFKMSYKERAIVQPVYRHSGKYQPKFIDIINFEDPYIANVYPNSLDRESQIRSNIRDKNTQLKIDSNFGLIKNMFYHKISDINKKGVLELTKVDAFKPLYPLIGEIAIDKKDFYIFSSNWDAGYFDRYIGKSNKVPVAGTRSIIEKKSFYGSKIMKILDELQVETFDAIQATSELELETIGNEILKPGNPYEIVYLDKPSQIIIDIYLEKRLSEVLANLGIKSYFDQYIKPEYGFGIQTSTDDDVYGYITNNILPRYKTDIIELYVLKTKDNNITLPVINSTVNDITKNMQGMTPVKDFNFNAISGRSNFNIRVIYNKTKGFYYSVAPSIKIIKK